MLKTKVLHENLNVVRPEKLVTVVQVVEVLEETKIELQEKHEYFVCQT